MKYTELSKNELTSLKNQLETEYEKIKAKGLSLDMSRGKPNSVQLDLSNKMNDILVSDSDYKTEAGFDVRNYGLLDGIPECRKLFADLLGVKSENVIVCGVSSLNIMYDYISQCMIFGAGDLPWCKQNSIKFLCPVPGYDRHFAILQHFGIEMINVPMNSDGPDMDFVENAVKDSTVKGLICVPMYSNPGGVSFSREVIERFGSLKPAAKDFRVIWDNAYCVHHLSDDCDKFYNIFEFAKAHGNEDMFIEVTSTSKITFPGAGISVLAASDNNIQQIKSRMTIQTIGYDKINQLRHAAFFGNTDGIKAHMKKHAAILKPKFDMVLSGLQKNLDGFASWTEPKGGYFISLDVMNGCAKRTVQLCKEAGVTLTGAGATYPYGNDPDDKNIRIAPTFPDTEELKLAVEILCVCVKIAEAEKYL